MNPTDESGAPGSRTLTGPTILLRDVIPGGDSERLFPPTHGSEDGEATWDYLGYGPFADAAAMRAWLEGCAASTDPRFRTVVDRIRDVPIGMVAFMAIRPSARVLEIGHIWYVPSARRTRANTETCYLMLCHAFDDLGSRRVEWKCNALNARSRAAALRLGFTYEGTFRKHMIVKGASRDTAWFALLDDDWPRVRRRLEARLADPPTGDRP